MKIGVLHNSKLPPANYGGIERIVVGLLAEYSRLGHEVVAICAKGSSLPGMQTCELPDHYQSKPMSSWLPRGLDFLHAHEPLCERPPLPFLVTIHGNGQTGETYWANTNFLSESHARNHGSTVFIYNGVDAALFPYQEKKEDYVVFLARASWRVKNLRTCINFANDTGVKLVVMGGTGRDSDRVHYKGMIGESQGKLEILAGAKALLYPTNWNEPCAVAPLEAMACGTPVIASSNGCMPELVGRETGFICCSYEEMLSAWQNIGQVRPQDCRRAIENKFSLQRMAAEYIALMKKIVAQGDLEQLPRPNFNADSIRYLCKPTVANRLRLRLFGKV